MASTIQKILGLSTTSLKRRLLVLPAAVLLIILLVIAAITSAFVTRTEQSAWQGRQTEATRNAVNEVTTFVQRVDDPLTIVSQLDRSSLQADPQILSIFLQQNPALLGLIRVDRNGHVFGSADRGTASLATLPALTQSNWFTVANSGKPFISDVQTGAEPYLIVAVPASDSVVAARVRVDILRDLVASIRFGDSGHAYLINRSGQILAYTGEASSLTLQGRPEFNTLLQAPDSRWNGEYVNINGDGVIGMTAPVPGTEWIVLTELAQNEAYAASHNALLLVAGILLLGLVVIAGTSQLLNLLIFKPVQNLRFGVEYIGQGDLNYRVPVARPDEIGQVTQAINEMAVRLRERDEELASRSEALAAEVGERERLITELQEANKRATEASRLKSEFLSTMSHELRTPLNAIIGFSAILLEGMAGELPETVKRMVNSIFNNSQHLLALINDILDLSKIEAGRMEFVAAPINVPDMVKQWHTQVSVLSENKGLPLIVNLAADVPRSLYGDQGRITQIAINLLSNAIKFTDTGKIELDVEWADGGLVLRITDTGIGIPPEAMNYIFDEFRQVDGSSQRRQGGTGLGLAIVQKLCHAMGGDIQVTSKLDEGSIFTARLPLQPLPESVSLQ